VEGIGTDQPSHGCARAQFAAEFPERVSSVRRPGTMQFAFVKYETRLTSDGQFDHPRALLGAGTGRRTMRRIGGGQETNLGVEGVARGARHRQMAGMHRIESAAVEKS
jgi:hypothetical protein